MTKSCQNKLEDKTLSHEVILSWLTLNRIRISKTSLFARLEIYLTISTKHTGERYKPIEYCLVILNPVCVEVSKQTLTRFRHFGDFARVARLTTNIPQGGNRDSGKQLAFSKTLKATRVCRQRLRHKNLSSVVSTFRYSLGPVKEVFDS